MTITISAQPGIVGSQEIYFTVSMLEPNLNDYTEIKITIPSDFNKNSLKEFYCSHPSCGKLLDSGDSFYISGGPYDPVETTFSFGVFDQLYAANFTNPFEFLINGKKTMVVANLKPRPLNALSIALASNTSYTKTVMTLDLVAPCDLNVGSKFNIYFPPLNGKAPSGLIRSSLEQNVKGNLFQGSSLINSTFASNESLLEVILQEAIQNGNTIKIEIQDFLTSNAVKTYYTIDFYIISLNLGYMYQKRNSSIQITSPNTPKTIVFTSSNQTINQKTTMNFTILPLSFISPLSGILIEFPIELQKNINNIAISGLKNFNGPVTFEYTLTSIKILKFNTDYIEDDTIVFSLINVTNPEYAVITNSFQVTLLDPEGYMTEKETLYLNYSAYPSNFKSFSMNSSNNYLGELAKYNFSFQSSVQLNSSVGIAIIFNSKYNISGITKLTPIAGMSSSATFEITSMNYILISNWFIDPSASSTVTFGLESVLNPGDLVADPKASVLTMIGKYFIDHNNVPLKLEPNKIFINSITLGSQESLATTDYVFEIECPIDIKKGDYIEIDYPKEFMFPFANWVEKNCDLTFLNQNSKAKCMFSNFSVFITPNITQNDVQISSGQKIQVTIPDNRNPHSILSTSPFKITLKTQSGSIKAENLNAYSIIIDKPSQITGWQINHSSNIVGASSVYYFSFTLNDILLQNDIIQIDFPEPLEICDSASFKIYSNNLAVRDSEAIGKRFIQFRSASSLSFGSNITLAIDCLINPPKIIKLAPFKIKFLDGSTNLTYSSYVDLQGVNNLKPMKLASVSMNFSKNYIGEMNDVIVKFKPHFTIPMSGKVLINIPDALTLTETVGCISTMSISCNSPQQNQTLIENFQLALEKDNIFEVTIQGFRNPLTQGTSSNGSFTIQTFSSDNLLMEEFTGYVPMTFKCQENCSSCQGNYTNCVKCVPGKVLIGSSCELTLCPTNYFQSLDSTCSQCMVPDSCSKCNPNKADQCIQCKGNDILYNGNCFPNTTDFQKILNLSNYSKDGYTSNSANSSAVVKNDSVPTNDTSNQTQNGKQNAYAVKESSYTEVFFWNTDFDNVPYVSSYLLLALTISAAYKISLKSPVRFLNFVITLICLMDHLALAILMVKLILFSEFIFFLCFMGIAILQTLVQTITSWKLREILRLDAEYEQNVESHCIFKIPRFITFFLNFRFAFLFSSGIGKFGSLNFSLDTRNNLERVIYRGLILVTFLSLSTAGFLIAFIFMQLTNEVKVPLFLYDYLAFSIAYFLLQSIRYCKKREIQSLQISIPDNKGNSHGKKSPTNDVSSLSGKNKGPNFIGNIIQNLTSGKKKDFMSLKKEKEERNKDSPLLTSSFSQKVNANSVAIKDPKKNGENQDYKAVSHKDLTNRDKNGNEDEMKLEDLEVSYSREETYNHDITDKKESPSKSEGNKKKKPNFMPKT